jgi:hypothetical protein
MEIAGSGRAEENNGFDVRPRGLTSAGHEFLELVFRNHVCFLWRR